MAELIDKGALIRDLESVSFTEDAKKMKVGSDAEMDGFFKGYVEGMLYFIPTTTEADIRAKAISDTIEVIKEHTKIVGSTTCEDLEQLAEQLKGE